MQLHRPVPWVGFTPGVVIPFQYDCPQSQDLNIVTFLLFIFPSCASRAREPRLRASLGATRGRRLSNIWGDVDSGGHIGRYPRIDGARGMTAATLKRRETRFNVSRCHASAKRTWSRCWRSPGNDIAVGGSSEVGRTGSDWTQKKTDSSELCKNFAACYPSRNLGETCGGKNTNKQTKKARPPLLNHMGATSHGMALLMGKHSAPGCQILVPHTSCLYIGFMQKVYVCVYKRTSTRAR